MAEKDYSHRSVVDKLGIKPGHALALGEGIPAIDPLLRQQITDATGRSLASEDEALDCVLAPVHAEADPDRVLLEWKERLRPSGAIWLLSPKRGLLGYVDQRELIDAGKRTGLVDNKVCSVSETISAMRFVFRKSDRPAR